jgi:hypothetical protein
LAIQRRSSDERRVRREGEASAQQPAVAQAARELKPSQRTCMQRGRPSLAISGNQWQSEAINGNQWQSMAIYGD